MCVKDTGTKYQLWISDFNIDGTFTRVHPFIISHTKTMTRTREDGKEEVVTNKKADYNWIRGNNGQDTDKAVRVLLLGGYAYGGSGAGSGRFHSDWVRSAFSANTGFFTTVKLD